MIPNGLFVTATDTGAGKTAVVAGLAAALIEQGIDAVVLKPLESGCTTTETGLIGPDSSLLCRITGASPDRIGVERTTWAVAPSVASRLTGVEELLLDELTAKIESMVPKGTFGLIEGIGGVLVPINSEHTIADLIHALGLPALLVVANRLGCLNHALLSVEALQSRGIEVAGWILNEPGPHDPDDVARNENHHELQRLIQAPCLGRLPYIAELHALPLPKFAQLAGEHLSPALKLITGEK